MIRINLLPQRKPKRRQAPPGQRDLLIGLGVVAVAAVLGFVLVHKRSADQLADRREANARFAADLDGRRSKISDIARKRSDLAAAREKTASIERLVEARAVPAHMLQELAEIMTPGRLPTMNREARKRRDQPIKSSDVFRDDWDPKHIWITELREDKGMLTLSGGAATDDDVDQLQKRMQASVYFEDVMPGPGGMVSDRQTQITYYQFTIVAKVVY
jgi:type IV pilus assembly protein PilN